MDTGPAVTDALRAIVAGTPVDWAALESNRPEESDHTLIRNLRVVAQIANFHRTLHETGETPHSSVEGAPPSVDQSAPPTWGALTLQERVGAGSFGEVYRAYDPRLDREVALKLLRLESASPGRLRSPSVHEGRLLARVR